MGSTRKQSSDLKPPLSSFMGGHTDTLSKGDRRIVNGSVMVRVHGGPKTGTVKEKVEPDSYSEPVC